MGKAARIRFRFRHADWSVLVREGNPGEDAVAVTYTWAELKAAEVIIRGDLTMAERVGAVVHEMTHVAQAIIAEQAAEHAEYLTMRALKRFGLLPVEDDD